MLANKLHYYGGGRGGTQGDIVTVHLNKYQWYVFYKPEDGFFRRICLPKKAKPSTCPAEHYMLLEHIGVPLKCSFPGCQTSVTSEQYLLQHQSSCKYDPTKHLLTKAEETLQ
jgi:hypothetical protein